jgi:hypothetical protein
MTCLLLALTLAQAAPAGQRIELDAGATVFVPDGYKPADGGVVDVVLHLHGAASEVEPAFVDAGFPGVLVAFNRKGLSSVYAGPFSDPALFPKLLDATLSALKTRGLADAPRLGRVVVSSFSAGFGGVRAILKVPEHFARVDGLVMADSLYCGYAGDPALRRVDPALMDGFRRFAAEAAEGRKTLLLTHSAQVPDGYASTTETADFLIASVGGSLSKADRDWGDGWTQTRSFSKGRFLVLGFSGTEGDDHMRHLRRIAAVWKRFREID